MAKIVNITICGKKYAVNLEDKEQIYLCSVLLADEYYSSGRYAIWKTVILSQKDHELIGYGSSSNAWEKRKAFIKSYDEKRIEETALLSVLIYGNIAGS